MPLGSCPACARPYTVGEVTGLGILRPRPESQGGPLMEFSCPDCGRWIVLIPYGQGRYARPGEPPSSPVPEEERAPPWVQKGKRRRPPPPPDREVPDLEEVDPDEAEEPVEGEPEPIEIPVPPPSAAERPITVEEALALLEVDLAAGREEIERAYRRKSRTCHPDKVAHLDLEFQELADRKFRRLKQAFDLLTT